MSVNEDSELLFLWLYFEKIIAPLAVVVLIAKQKSGTPVDDFHLYLYKDISIGLFCLAEARVVCVGSSSGQTDIVAILREGTSCTSALIGSTFIPSLL